MLARAMRHEAAGRKALAAVKRNARALVRATGRTRPATRTAE
jgi:hypothetical protein